MADNPIVLVGCGRMGGAILRGLGEGTGPKPEVFVIDPQVTEVPGATVLSGLGDLARFNGKATVLLAIKPQGVAGLLPSLKPFVGPDMLFISIIAGVSVDIFRSGLGDDLRMIRAMPNTPAGVLAGITALVAGEGVSDAQRADCEALLGAVGETVWLEREALIDSVTAISGSGPAYFFRFAEALAAAGRELGLPDAVAERLARRTFEGAGVLSASTDRSLGDLRTEVTSPGGTTAAALRIFDEDARLQTLTIAAARAAEARSRSLAAEAKAALG
jgi:pyrroline-5-carboxylate reductase